MIIYFLIIKQYCYCVCIIMLLIFVIIIFLCSINYFFILEDQCFISLLMINLNEVNYITFLVGNIVILIYPILYENLTVIFTFMKYGLNNISMTIN